jgi:hypothetical protein
LRAPRCCLHNEHIPWPVSAAQAAPHYVPSSPCPTHFRNSRREGNYRRPAATVRL